MTLNYFLDRASVFSCSEAPWWPTLFLQMPHQVPVTGLGIQTRSQGLASQERADNVNSRAASLVTAGEGWEIAAKTLIKCWQLRMKLEIKEDESQNCLIWLLNKPSPGTGAEASKTDQGPARAIFWLSRSLMQLKEDLIIFPWVIKMIKMQCLQYASTASWSLVGNQRQYCTWFFYYLLCTALVLWYLNSHAPSKLWKSVILHLLRAIISNAFSMQGSITIRNVG